LKLFWAGSNASKIRQKFLGETQKSVKKKKT
jgi:alpha-tubulin suppressor-like RCC1 family protein